MSTLSVPSVREHTPRPGRSPIAKAGIVISALVTAFLTFDAAGKLAGVPQVKEGTQALGFPAGQALIMGVVLALCLVVYVIPRTAVLGALGITAYLGGAVTANMRVEAPLFSNTLFAVYLGVLVWIGLAMRRPQLLEIVGLRRPSHR
jgi:DoxX-like family